LAENSSRLFGISNSKEGDRQNTYTYIPEISYCWRAVADYLEYPTAKKKEIGNRQPGDHYDCCAKLIILGITLFG